MIFSNSSPTYFNLTPIESSGSDDGGLGTGALIAIIAGAVVLVGLIVFFAMRSRSSREDRE